MANIIKFGSILLNGAHTEPVSAYQPGQAISFGDGDTLQWAVINSMLIAAGPLLTNISWANLHQQDLVFGKQVSINRQQFFCRLLKVGTKECVHNEWDDALDAVSEDNGLWNCGDAFCWGQDAPDEYAPYRAHRRYDSGLSPVCHSNLMPRFPPRLSTSPLRPSVSWD